MEKNFMGMGKQTDPHPSFLERGGKQAHQVKR
jgi:hypothetical protein